MAREEKYLWVIIEEMVETHRMLGMNPVGVSLSEMYYDKLQSEAKVYMSNNGDGVRFDFEITAVNGIRVYKSYTPFTISGTGGEIVSPIIILLKNETSKLKE